MANSEIILANAERFYVIERMTEKEVAQQVGVHGKTLFLKAKLLKLGVCSVEMLLY